MFDLQKVKKILPALLFPFLCSLSLSFSACIANEKPSDSSLSTNFQNRYSSFPDTIFSSVEHLVYQIDVFDSVNSGLIVFDSSFYADSANILTFRGNPFRSAPFVGRVNGQPDTVLVDWTFVTAYDSRPNNYGVWGGGNGWTGQPLFVHWSDSLMNKFRLLSPALTPHFAQDEIIVASLCSRLYFINLATGDSSRKSIYVGNPIKGTPSIDPSFNGNIYIGQGIPCEYPFGALTVNLFSHNIVHFQPQDRKAWRGWGAYDSSPIRVGQFLFRPGENGTLYKYLIRNDSIFLHSTLRFKLPGRGAAGMEASMAVCANYGFVSDNYGNILCINLNNLQPVWHYSNHDDSDASPVLQWEDSLLCLYSGCEVDKQGSSGYCYIVKLNALNGDTIWTRPLACRAAMMGKQRFDGGLFATPLVGVGNCNDLLFVNVVTNDKPGMKGDFVALRRSDGSVVYRTTLKHYAWSSPVAFLNENNEMFVFTADTQGRVYLIDAASGKILCCKQVGSNFEGSPAVIGNSVVLGSRGRKIFKLSIH